MERFLATLKGSRHLWLTNPENLTSGNRLKELETLRQMLGETSRAWAPKETAMGAWRYHSGTRHGRPCGAGRAGQSNFAPNPFVSSQRQLNAALRFWSGRSTTAYQRSCRGHQLANPVHQVHRPRLPQSRTLSRAIHFLFGGLNTPPEESSTHHFLCKLMKRSLSRQLASFYSHMEGQLSI